MDLQHACSLPGAERMNDIVKEIAEIKARLSALEEKEKLSRTLIKDNFNYAVFIAAFFAYMLTLMFLIIAVKEGWLP